MKHDDMTHYDLLATITIIVIFISVLGCIIHHFISYPNDIFVTALLTGISGYSICMLSGTISK